MAKPKESIKESVSKIVWLIGDRYFDWFALEKKPSIDNDPEHQPYSAVLNRHPRYYFLPGGVWYVKRFLERVCRKHKQYSIIVPDLPPETRKPSSLIPFVDGISAASFTLEQYKKEPNGKDAVYRIKSHHKYYSALADLKSKNKDGSFQKQIRNYLDEEKFLYTKTFLNQGPPDCLVIEDMGMGFRDSENDAWRQVFDYIHRDSESIGKPIIVLLGRSLPLWRSEIEQRDFPRNEDLWEFLLNKHSNETAIIVNADLLRYTGANISRRISWEQTAQDCVEELTKNPKFAPLSEFAHLIIRFGVTAAIHCYKRKNGIKVFSFYYDSRSSDGVFRNVEEEGGVIGNNSVFAACLLEQITSSENAENQEFAVSQAIKKAIPSCQRLFRYGYGSGFENVDLDKLHGWDWPSQKVFLEDENASITKHGGVNPTHSKFICNVENVPVRGKQERQWKILEHSKVDEQLLGFNMVKFGSGEILNNPESKIEIRINTPVARFGDLATADRDEIEGFRSMANIIGQYLRTIKRDPMSGPMSAAVFGPPGSGKSYTVSEIVKSVDPAIKENFIEINMAQLTSADELASHLLRVNELVGRNKIPLVFFDEFDSKIGGEWRGWLKYFLAPMEGGQFKHPKEGVFRINKGIFFFAGGTANTYAEFITRDKKVAMDFKAAKVNDFVSRLRGYIDIKGINATGPIKDNLHLIRRAMIFRSLLERNALIHDGDSTALMDDDLIFAFLKVERFNYDTRSLRSLIDMCLRLHGRIEKASLPIRKIMEMHIDANKFFNDIKSVPDVQKNPNRLHISDTAPLS